MEENSWIICGKIKLRFINAQKSSLEIAHKCVGRPLQSMQTGKGAARSVARSCNTMLKGDGEPVDAV